MSAPLPSKGSFENTKGKARVWPQVTRRDSLQRSQPAPDRGHADRRSSGQPSPGRGARTEHTWALLTLRIPGLLRRVSRMGLTACPLGAEKSRHLHVFTPAPSGEAEGHRGPAFPAQVPFPPRGTTERGTCTCPGPPTSRVCPAFCAGELSHASKPPREVETVSQSAVKEAGTP